MAEAKGRAAELREIHRARNPEEARAWTDLRAGRVEEALTWYRDQGLLRLYDTRPELLHGMLEEWWAAGPDRGVMVVDTSNEERDELNAMAQARRHEAGELGAEALRMENGREVRVGDRVLFNAIYYPLAGLAAGLAPPRVENGTVATIVGVDLEAGTAVLRLHEPKAKGDRASADRVLTLPASMPVELGYARHVMKAQGMTADVANVATGPHTAHNELYVMVTRSRDGTRIHTLRAEVEDMGADPCVLDQPANPQREVTPDDLMADLRARDLSTPQGQEERGGVYPAERHAMEQARTEQAAQALPPGATPGSEFAAGTSRERVPVSLENPAAWAHTVDQVTDRAKRSTTKHAIGRRAWTPMSEWTATVADAADQREPWQGIDRSGGDENYSRDASRRSPPRPQPSREAWPEPLPGRQPIDSAARDHARWCNAPKVLASYEVACRLDIAADPAEQAARRWLADRAAVIVVADHGDEQLVRQALARVLRSDPELASSPQVEPPRPAATALAEAQLPAVSPAAEEYRKRLAALPPRSTPRPEEPRIVHATAGYEERMAKRAALGIRRAGPDVVEPDVEPRAYVVAPIAPGSGWPYRDMTRALSVAAETHLIIPAPDQDTAQLANREAEQLKASLASARRAEQVRQAAAVEELRTASRRREPEAGRSRERGREREAAA